MQYLRATCATLLLAATLPLVGCQDPTPPVGEVTGVVTIDGKPLPKVSVLFIPADSQGFSGITSSAITDDNGHYTLEYKIPNPSNPAEPVFGAGALVGSHAVVVSDYKMMAELLPPPGRIPQRYTDPGTTPLGFDVTEGSQSIDIELQL